MVFSQILTFYRSDLAKIRKIEKLFEDELDVEDIKCPVKIKDIHKIEINNSIGISVFVYESKGKYSLYVSRNTSKESTIFLLKILKLSCMMVILSYFASWTKAFCHYFLQALFSMDFFGAAHVCGKSPPPLLPKISHVYPALMRLGTVIPYPKKIWKIH